METQVSNVFIDIYVDNAPLRAAICPQCEARIYPARLLKFHLEHHEHKKRFLEEELRKVQTAMGRIR